jgi:hypothetical protein
MPKTNVPGTYLQKTSLPDINPPHELPPEQEQSSDYVNANAMSRRSG